MNKLEKARAYEKKKQKTIPEDTRPAYHVIPAIGWMNDPNGFSEYKDEYHLFYQYYPYDVIWGPMHWGHCTTKDFIRWEYAAAALAPDESYETGCFSGSALENSQGEHFLMYTSHYEDREKNINEETQSIAIGDGLNYHKYENNPVITKEMIPEGFSGEDFRDPKIWLESDDWYAVIGAKKEDGRGAVLLYESNNGYQWEYRKVLFENSGKYGKMWECPDFFELDGKSILIVSPMEMKSDGLEFHDGYGVIYSIGDYDRMSYDYKSEKIKTLEYGLDFYAPQSMRTKDGRRIMIGWMRAWDNDMTPKGFLWTGSMTIPRELTIKSGILCQWPVREIQNYYQNEVYYEHQTLEAGIKKTLPGIAGRTFDLTIEVQTSDFSELTISFAENEQYRTTVTICKDREILQFSRRFSGMMKDVNDSRIMPVEFPAGQISLRILADKYSMEIFVNQGQQAMTFLITTPLEAEGISFLADAETKINVRKYDIVL